MKVKQYRNLFEKWNTLLLESGEKSSKKAFDPEEPEIAQAISAILTKQAEESDQDIYAVDISLADQALEQPEDQAQAKKSLQRDVERFLFLSGANQIKSDDPAGGGSPVQSFCSDTRLCEDPERLKVKKPSKRQKDSLYVDDLSDIEPELGVDDSPDYEIYDSPDNPSEEYDSPDRHPPYRVLKKTSTGGDGEGAGASPYRRKLHNKKLYEIVKDLIQEGVSPFLLDEAATAKRGGIEAQKATAQVLNEGKLKGTDRVAISNISGSGIPDVVVVDNSKLGKGKVGPETPMDADLWNKLVGIKGAVVAEFEIKSSTPNKKNVYDVMYFDQTLGEEDQGEPYFSAILEKMVSRIEKNFRFYKKEDLEQDSRAQLFPKTPESYMLFSEAKKELAKDKKFRKLVWDKKRKKYIQGPVNEPAVLAKLVDIMLTQAYYLAPTTEEEADKMGLPKKCGSFGEVNSPSVEEDVWYSLGEWNTWEGAETDRPKFAQKGWGSKNFKDNTLKYTYVSAMPLWLKKYGYVIFVVDDSDVATSWREKGKRIGKQRTEGNWKIFVSKESEELAEPVYQFVSAREIAIDKRTTLYKQLKSYGEPSEGEEYIANPRFFIMVGGSPRAATTSGSFDPDCFKIVTADRSEDVQSVVTEVADQLEKHWTTKVSGDNWTSKGAGTTWGDDYFVVAQRIVVGKTKEEREGNYYYEKVFIFSARGDDPLGLGVSSYRKAMVGDLINEGADTLSVAFGSFGTPSRDKQSRVKIYSDLLLEPNAANAYKVQPCVHSEKLGRCPNNKKNNRYDPIIRKKR